MRALVTLLVALWMVAACTGTSGASPTVPALATQTAAPTAVATPAAPTTAATPIVTPASTASPTAVAGSPGTSPAGSVDLPDLVGEVPEDVLLEIMQQVAASTGSSLADLTLVEARAVTWNDSSLGCPEPGQFYTQALVDGYWVVIEAGGQTYDFRIGANNEFRFCPPGQGQPPPDLPD